MTDTYTKEVFRAGSGYAYRILRNGIIETNQDFAPGLPGQVVMTEAEANAYADSVINAKMNPPIPPTTVTFDTKLASTDLAKVTQELDKLGYKYKVNAMTGDRVGR
jgi:hypothetical protein